MSRRCVLRFALEGIAVVLWLATRTDPVLFVLLSGVVFFGWGEIFSLFPATLTDTFGAKFATANYGWLYIAFGIGAIYGGPLAAPDRISEPNSWVAGVRYRHHARYCHRGARDFPAQTAARTLDGAAAGERTLRRSRGSGGPRGGRRFVRRIGAHGCRRAAGGLDDSVRRRMLSCAVACLSFGWVASVRLGVRAFDSGGVGGGAPRNPPCSRRGRSALAGMLVGG